MACLVFYDIVDFVARLILHKFMVDWAWEIGRIYTRTEVHFIY